MKKFFLNNFDSKINPLDKLFYIGLFLLPSAFSIATILLLISLIISTFNRKDQFFKDKLNIFFLAGGVLMILSSFVHTFKDNLTPYELNSNLTWIGLANWLPFFWCYWGFKPFLNSYEKRKKSGLILLSGTFPVLITGIGQYFFNWNGPFEIFNGLIIWYQRPLNGETGLTGLFNNPNYAGCWLNIIWPFCLAALIDKGNNFIQNISIYFFNFGISISTILTNSRSSWVGIFLGILLMFGEKSLKLISVIIIIISIIFGATLFPIFGDRIQNFLQTIIPELMLDEFSDFQYSRIEIWRSGINLAIDNPFFGTGASSFPEIFKYQTNLWKGHAHNLPLELIISYGIPAALMIIIPITNLTYQTVRFKLFEKNGKESSIYDQAWISALVILLASQMVDVQYFDGRISIIMWTLLSGSQNIIEEKYSTKK